MCCPICGSRSVTEEILKQHYPSGSGPVKEVVKVAVPVSTCQVCSYQWSDYRGEEAVVEEEEPREKV